MSEPFRYPQFTTLHLYHIFIKPSMKYSSLTASLDLHILMMSFMLHNKFFCFLFFFVTLAFVTEVSTENL